MLNWLWAGIMLLSLIGGALNGRMEEVNKALLNGGEEAITLSLTLGGAICLWSGMMRVAEKAGFTEIISRILSPVLRLLFPGLSPSCPAAKAILLNMSANFLGLGNAATPFGLKAMEELQKLNPEKNTASKHMITFVVLNTASIQLLPTTVATLRLKYGSASPMQILPAVWITSIGAAAAALLMANLLEAAHAGKTWVKTRVGRALNGRHAVGVGAAPVCAADYRSRPVQKGNGV